MSCAVPWSWTSSVRRAATFFADAVADARLLRVGERLEQRDAAPVGVRLQPRERRVADPALRAVRDPEQRDQVERVVDHLQVGDQSP